MEKKDIIKKYNQKIKILKKHNKLYFSNDKPQISDSEYDKIKKEILNLEKKYKFLKKNNLVGSPPSNKFTKVKHLVPMLSLSNAFDENDMRVIVMTVPIENSTILKTRHTGYTESS